MGKYFGTDGFRGEAGINLTADHAFKVGRFLGWYYTQLKHQNNGKRKIASTLFFNGDCFFSHRSLFLADLFRKSLRPWQ